MSQDPSEKNPRTKKPNPKLPVGRPRKHVNPDRRAWTQENIPTEPLPPGEEFEALDGQPPLHPGMTRDGDFKFSYKSDLEKKQKTLQVSFNDLEREIDEDTANFELPPTDEHVKKVNAIREHFLTDGYSEIRKIFQLPVERDRTSIRTFNPPVWDREKNGHVTHVESKVKVFDKDLAEFIRDTVVLMETSPLSRAIKYLDETRAKVRWCKMEMEKFKRENHKLKVEKLQLMHEIYKLVDKEKISKADLELEGAHEMADNPGATDTPKTKHKSVRGPRFLDD